jgi:DNA adenine methylase
MADQRSPEETLDVAFKQALEHPDEPLVDDAQMVERVEYVCRNRRNRAGVRLMMACLLAKADDPDLDIRKPYTEIGDPDSFSGRRYDEKYVYPFVNARGLPCNRTTAFLTPAFRNRDMVLTPDVDLVGRPPKLYASVLQLLDDVHTGKVLAKDLLTEFMRQLISLRNESQQRLNEMVRSLGDFEGGIPLSSENIVTLIEQHLACPRSSRLPVLVVAAAYEAAREHLGERVSPLQDHHAADLQTRSLGDLEITLMDDNEVITSYEMKTRRVTREDIDAAVEKIHNTEKRVDNYIFITTETIKEDVREYAVSLYERIGGIEIAVLDCISFLRHFLHLFHRLRTEFLESYQRLLLAEPDSAVRQELKEAFLSLRRAAESSLEDAV